MEKEVERQEKLQNLQRRHRELTAQRKALLTEERGIQDKLRVNKKELEAVGGAIYDLKNVNGDTPHITDHAVVRYLERVKGLDIWSIKSEIMQYKESVRIDNTIVTVNEEAENDGILRS